MDPTNGQLFGAFLAGLAIGAFALYAWRTWREVVFDETLLAHYCLTQEEWDRLTPAAKDGARAAYRVKLEEQRRG